MSVNDVIGSSIVPCSQLRKPCMSPWAKGLLKIASSLCFSQWHPVGYPCIKPVIARPSGRGNLAFYVRRQTQDSSPRLSGIQNDTVLTITLKMLNRLFKKVQMQGARDYEEWGVLCRTSQWRTMSATQQMDFFQQPAKTTTVSRWRETRLRADCRILCDPALFQ